MKAFGDEIRSRFSNELGTVRGEGMALELQLPAPGPVDHVVLMEDIRFGERVRAYRVEARVAGAWVQVASGIAIGHKKIDPFPAVTTDRLRFTALKTAGTPILRAFSALYAGKIPVRKLTAAPRQQVVMEFGSQHYDHRTGRARFTLALSPFIREAGQYRLAFRLTPDSRDPLVLSAARLEIGGIPQPDYLTREAAENSFLLYIPGTGPQVVFTADSACASVPSLQGDVVIEQVIP